MNHHSANLNTAGHQVPQYLDWGLPQFQQLPPPGPGPNAQGYLSQQLLPGYQIDPPAAATEESEPEFNTEQHFWRLASRPRNNEVQDPAHSQIAPPSQAPVLRAAAALVPQGTTYGNLAQCKTIEDGLVEILAAGIGGKRLRVGQLLLILEHMVTSQEGETGTFACMCLINMRADRSATSVGRRYILLADALPRCVPTEMLPYVQAIVERCRDNIVLIRNRDLPNFNQGAGEVSDALTRIEDRLSDYVQQAAGHDQISLKFLQDKATQLRSTNKPRRRATNNATSGSPPRQLKRRHSEIVRQTTQQGDDSAAVAAQNDSISLPHFTPMPPMPTTQPENPSSLQPTLYVNLPRMFEAPPPPAWGPAGYAAELLSRRPFATHPYADAIGHTLQLLAVCPHRHALASVMEQLSVEGFVSTLNVMRQEQPQKAAQLAFYLTLHYIEYGLHMHEAALSAVVSALPQLGAWPRDVRFTFTLMDQLKLQPQSLRDAMENLINRLLQGG